MTLKIWDEYRPPFLLGLTRSRCHCWRCRIRETAAFSPSSRWDRRPNQRLRWRSCGALVVLERASRNWLTAEISERDISYTSEINTDLKNSNQSLFQRDFLKGHGFMASCSGPVPRGWTSPYPLRVFNESKWGQGSLCRGGSSPTGLLAGSRYLSSSECATLLKLIFEGLVWFKVQPLHT